MEINQQTLLQRMADPASSAEDLEALEGLVSAYPYFQLGHTLIAKAKHDRQTPDAAASLNHAAIYAPSRRRLRQIFYEELHINLASAHTPGNATEHPPLSAPEENVSEEIPTENTKEVNTQEASPDTPTTETPSEETEQTPAEAPAPNDRLYQELEENLQHLRASRAKEAENNPPEDTTSGTDKPGEEPSALTILQIGGEDQPGSKHDADDTHYLLDYLRDHQSTPPASLDDSQQRQVDLIDKFMKAERDVKTRWKAQEKPSGEDLSERSPMEDNFATENLAEIYTRQGRPDKAIKIYQQLILKYPEKRTYFAEKIESLTEE